VAFNPALAEQMFAERRPELSIVDLMMTGGGLELCGRLASDGAAPVLAMSALDLADEAISMGASAFLAKPVVPLQFVSTVRDLLGSSALTRPSTATIS
jgi:DNA-binding response OmpR family regulator